MKKVVKVIVLCLILAVLIGCFCSCETINQRFKRIKQVKSEVDYGYTVVDGRRIIKNNKIYEYEKLVGDIVEYKTEDKCYYIDTVENYVYVKCEYALHGRKTDIKNERTIDIGLFRINIDTLVCEFVYDFKNVYPTYRDDYHPYLGTIIDADRMVIQYNGTIKILDLQRKCITYSAKVYDKETFLSTESWDFHYKFNRYGDYIKIVDDILYYYQLDGYKFKFHKFDINYETEWASRFGNYVYTRGYIGNKAEYLDCYDLTNNQKVDLDILADEISRYEEEQKRLENEENTYTINGKDYYIDFSFRYQLNLLDNNKNQICCIDANLIAENSKTFVDLWYLWWNTNRLDCEIVDFKVVDDKLFVGFSDGSSWVRTPTFIFEYDIENGDFKYVGFAYEHDIGDLRLSKLAEDKNPVGADKVVSEGTVPNEDTTATFKCYGRFGETYVLVPNGMFDEAITEEEVGGVVYRHSQVKYFTVYNNGVLYRLQEAYDSGLLSHNDLLLLQENYLADKKLNCAVDF